MTDKMAIRTFPTAYKLKAIKRAEGGEGVLPVARKLGISRKLLHDWIKAWKAHGPEGVNRTRGRWSWTQLADREDLSGHVDSRTINAGGLAC